MSSLFSRIYKVRFMGVRIICGFLILFIIIQTSDAQNNLWFSNKPPPDDIRSKPSGMHSLSSVKGKRGMSSVIQWLREGNHPLTSDYIEIPNTEFDFHIYSPTGKDSVGTFNGSYLSYPSKEEGYYNAYLIVKNISKDTLYVDIAKAEMLNHSCRNGHKNVRKHIGPLTYPETIPAEIIRKRNSSEDFHYFASSGDKIDYQFIINGNPIEGANLIFNTQTGWQKVLPTDKDGISSFQILQDYFSNWQELNNHIIYDYVIFGEVTVKEEGNYFGNHYSYIHYTSSLSDGYRPARTMYMSMFWAFIVFMTTFVISVVGVFIYQRNRNKVYKEIHFNEKD